MFSINEKRLDRSAFPHRVFDLPAPPRHLYLVGELPSGPSAAVVGTRRPTEDAVQYTAQLVKGLNDVGITVWSGGAEGIDIAAHRAAMQLGAPTVVVAPAGWGRPYPPEHAQTYVEIVQSGGAYLSLVPAERAAQRHLFFARNALLIALVDVVVIVQAGFRSGARNAAKFARKLGRTIFVAPSCPWVHQGIGCNLELTLGARVLVSPKQVAEATSALALSRANFARESYRERKIFEETCPRLEMQSVPVGNSPMHRGCSRPREKVVADPDLDAELSGLLTAIRGGARTVDALCERSGLPPAVVQSDVLRLTLLGLVRTGRVGGIEIVSG